MNIIATGATSFVGAAAVKELLRRGHHVTAVVRKNSVKTDKLMEDGKNPENLRILSCDLREIGSLPGLLKNRDDMPGTGSPAAYDVFLHMGWLGAGSGDRGKRELQEENVVCTLDAVRAAGELGCRRFLFTGSQAEYGIREGLTDEGAECRPTSPYGEAKLKVREEAEPLCRSLGMDYGHARIFSTYGPGDHPWSLISSCIRTFREDGLMEMTPCTQMWNFLYIDDAGRAIADLAEYPGQLLGEGAVYNLGGSMEETLPLRDFVKEIRNRIGSGTCCFGIHPYNAEGPVNLEPDIRKMERVTGWTPQVSFEEGIRRTLAAQSAG